MYVFLYCVLDFSSLLFQTMIMQHRVKRTIQTDTLSMHLKKKIYEKQEG